jgi:hypothetical protein
LNRNDEMRIGMIGGNEYKGWRGLNVAGKKE